MTQGFWVAAAEFACPTCGHVMNGVRGEDHRPPRDGDMAVCESCTTVARFDAGGTALRVLTDAEQAAIPAHVRDTVVRLRHVARAAYN